MLRPFGTHGEKNFDSMCLLEFASLFEPYYPQDKKVPVYEDDDIDDEVGGYAEHNFNIDENIDQPRPLLTFESELP